MKNLRNARDRYDRAMARVQAIPLAYNTVYLVEDAGERILIDTGPDYQGASSSLADALGERSPALVVATHGHLDHAGLGRWWQDERHVPVAMGANDAHLAAAPQFTNPAELEAFATWVRSTGAPPEVEREIMQSLQFRREWAITAATEPGYPVVGRDRRWPSGLRYRSFTPARLVEQDCDMPAGLRVLAAPGHTPGNLVLVHEAEGWLFSGDQLLPEITPTPAIQPVPPGQDGDWRFRSLPAFVRSLKRLQEIPFERCFPGHGAPFGHIGQVISTNLAQIEQRTEKVAEALARPGNGSVWSLSEALYPRAARRRFWQIAATIQGHLDLLEAEGRVRQGEGRYELNRG